VVSVHRLIQRTSLGTVVLHHGFRAEIDGEFLRSEKLFAIDFAIDDPAISKPFLARVGDGDGLEIMVVLEFRIHVFGPVELIHDEVEIQVLVLHEQAPRNAVFLAMFN